MILSPNHTLSYQTLNLIGNSSLSVEEPPPETLYSQFLEWYTLHTMATHSQDIDHILSLSITANLSFSQFQASVPIFTLSFHSSHKIFTTKGTMVFDSSTVSLFSSFIFHFIFHFTQTSKCVYFRPLITAFTTTSLIQDILINLFMFLFPMLTQWILKTIARVKGFPFKNVCQIVSEIVS